MGRARDISKVFSTGTALATDSEVSGSYLTQTSASTTYQTKAAAGLTLLTPTSIANTGGTASIGANGTVTFSGISTVSLNNVFSATYKNYYMALNIDSGTSNNNVLFRFRVAGSDNSSNVYRRAGTYAGLESSTSGFDANIVTNYWYLGTFLNGAYPNTSNVEIMNPFETTRTYAWTRDIANGGTYFTWNYGNVHTSETSFTGFTVYTDGGTVAGSISVYGYNK